MFSIHFVEQNLIRIAKVIRSGKKLNFADMSSKDPSSKKDETESGTATKHSKAVFNIKVKQLEDLEHSRDESIKSEKSSRYNLDDSRDSKDHNEPRQAPIVVLPVLADDDRTTDRPADIDRDLATEQTSIKANHEADDTSKLETTLRIEGIHNPVLDNEENWKL